MNIKEFAKYSSNLRAQGIEFNEITKGFYAKKQLQSIYPSEYDPAKPSFFRITCNGEERYYVLTEEAKTAVATLLSTGLSQGDIIAAQHITAKKPPRTYANVPFRHFNLFYPSSKETVQNTETKTYSVFPTREEAQTKFLVDSLNISSKKAPSIITKEEIDELAPVDYNHSPKSEKEKIKIAPRIIEEASSKLESRAEFEEFALAELNEISHLLKRKGLEYSRLAWDSNFIDSTGFLIGGEVHKQPEVVLWNFNLKHLTSIKNIIEDLASGRIASDSLLQEKTRDVISYMLILQGMFKKRNLKK